jgi:hypothetical protein
MITTTDYQTSTAAKLVELSCAGDTNALFNRNKLPKTIAWRYLQEINIA